MQGRPGDGASPDLARVKTRTMASQYIHIYLYAIGSGGERGDLLDHRAQISLVVVFLVISIFGVDDLQHSIDFVAQITVLFFELRDAVL